MSARWATSEISCNRTSLSTFDQIKYWSRYSDQCLDATVAGLYIVTVHCTLFIETSGLLSWLSWAVDKPFSLLCLLLDCVVALLLWSSKVWNSDSFFSPKVHSRFFSFLMLLFVFSPCVLLYPSLDILAICFTAFLFLFLKDAGSRKDPICPFCVPIH